MLLHNKPIFIALHYINIKLKKVFLVFFCFHLHQNRELFIQHKDQKEEEKVFQGI